VTDHVRLSRSGDFGFVPGVLNAEDLAPVPGTRWLIGSGLDLGRNEGRLHLVDGEQKRAEPLLAREFKVDPVGDPYPCGEPPDAGLFDAHGLALREDGGGFHTLFVVNHGGREAIEVFAVDARHDRPALAWIGAVPQAQWVTGNAVAPLADGGLVATNFMHLTDPAAIDLVLAGEVSGSVMEWHPGQGWEVVPGSWSSAPNGIEVSTSGDTLFIAEWSRRKLVRLSRGTEPVERDEIHLDFLPDNIKWGEDGRILVAGQFADPGHIYENARNCKSSNVPVAVIAVDPQSLEVEELARFDDDNFGMATTALQHRGTLWISSARNDLLAYARTGG
jgi:hypothetical protein